MANSLYDIGREGFLTEITVGDFTGKIDWANDNIRVALLDDTYEYNASHASYADVQPAVVADVALTNMHTVGNGTALADSTTFPAVVGNEAVAVVIYRAVGADEPTAAEYDDCPLIAYFDDGIAGLPVTPNGGDITVLWNGGNGQIFRL